MRKTACAMLVAAAWLGMASAASREDLLRDDLVRGLTIVCLPAQASGTTAADYVSDREADLNLERVRPLNDPRAFRWALSLDRRVLLSSEPDVCLVSVTVRAFASSTLIADLRSDLAEIATEVGEQELTDGPEGVVRLFCTDGEEDGSFVLLTREGRGGATRQSRIGEPMRSVVLAVPRESTC